MKKATLAALAAAALTLAACGSPAPKPDKYCPGVMHALPKSSPQDYQTALNDMTGLTAVIPPGNDKPLDNRVLAVERALEAIGKADINPFAGASANQTAAFYTAAKNVRTYCQAHS